MSANALLLWMSARGQGSWQQFRTAIEELRVEDSDDLGGEEDDAPDQFALPLYQILRFNFQRTGHAEFFAGAGDADWRVTPPSLAVTRNTRGWLGIVVGARTQRVMRRFHENVEPTNVETVVCSGYPDQLLVVANDIETLKAVAKRSGLIFQSDAPAALLTSLPPIDDSCVRHTAQLPFGADWKIDRFSSKGLVWRSATLNDAASASGGLFRFSLRHQRHVLFCQRGKAFRIPGQVGKYLILSRRRRGQILRYDKDRFSLEVPASCRPPFLIERALILCSGSPPTYEGKARTGILRYSEIPSRIASMAASLLRQEIL